MSHLWINLFLHVDILRSFKWRFFLIYIAQYNQWKRTMQERDPLGRMFNIHNISLFLYTAKDWVLPIFQSLESSRRRL